MQETDSKYTLITGQYQTALPEQKKMIQGILGSDQIEYHYKIYFHWYNVIHELGHAILHFNQHDEFSDLAEEPIVNDLAVAFWSYYSDISIWDTFHDIVNHAINRFACPAPDGMDYMEYAKKNWGGKDFFTFNNYGWFQFRCVQDALSHPKPLEDALRVMSTNPIRPQPKQLLVYDLTQENIAKKIVRDATRILRRWGVTLPDLPHLLVDDPNRHGFSTTGR